MGNATPVFDKRQRKLISDEIRGIREGSIAVVNYPAKVQEILKKGGLLVDKDKISQHMYWATNNQDTFRAAYMVLLDERPEQLKALFDGQQLMSLQPISSRRKLKFFTVMDNEPDQISA